ncbi:ROK family transcriptional regulator [Microbacterium galbinum]|uniref:ROK family protein n=1 Tax=Microbacterium galbinum TaxID=2851646 RepID=A0ABY4IQZ7_9MICO|nr:ROK family transcriptional regulator [Microbacterium galbinum]UPL13973.1 ROK family protein [Microbacterium galbinum]
MPRDLTTPRSREANLARILSIVHHDGAQSRSALTEATGLNRSTIAALVFELAAAGLVDERPPESSSRAGRPSPVVAPSASVVAISVHPEVDAVEIAAVALDRRIVVRERIVNTATPTAAEVAALVAARLAHWQTDALLYSTVIGIGVAVPGLVRTADGVVRNAPHLAWTDEPLAARIEELTGIRTAVDNDATLGALAEHLFGAGRDIDELVYLNGGASGIGGGLVIHGRAATGANGYAGEFGHNRPRIDDDADRRTSDGVLEEEVNRRHLLALLGLDDADDAALAAALDEAGLPAAEAEVARQARVLGSALANAVNVLNPAVVVLGGFLALLDDAEHDTLAAEVSRLAMSESAEVVELRTAALGSDRLLVGAAELAFRPLWTDPLAVVAG